MEAERAFVALLAIAAGHLFLARGAWPGPSTSATLAAIALPLASWALLISRTRNAWIGALAGLTVIALMRAPRLLWGLAAAVALVLVLRPAAVMERLTLSDASSRDRYFMWQAGIDMVRDRPVFGQGPRMVESNYPGVPLAGRAQPRHARTCTTTCSRSRPSAACPAWPGGCGGWRPPWATPTASRGARRAWTAVAALALLAAIMAAGLFEYNFGDSEILMMLLIVCALPYALRAERGEIAPQPAAVGPATAGAIA